MAVCLLRLLLQRMHGLITSELRERNSAKKGSYFLADVHKSRKRNAENQ
jgi:hypothetical protein